MIFRDDLGIVDLKFGYKHGLYIQGRTNKVLSWGDKTFGQTGNNMQEGFAASKQLQSNDEVEF
jgi:alpha-tubulin suppressor-like RCC1 family protein